jgi:hypothetical protein
LIQELRNVGILYDNGVSKSTYEAVLKSRLVVFYRTTVGIEALALNKKVLYCNYDAKNHYYSNKHDVGCLVNDNYFDFRSKVLDLLDNTTEEVDLYYKNLKKDYMNLTKNPSIVISDTICSILSCNKVQN